MPSERFDLFAPTISSQADFCLKLHQNSSPTVILGSTEKQLCQILSDIQALCKAQKRHITSLYYPSHDKDLLAQAKINLASATERLNTLHHIPSHPILLCTLPGLYQHTLPQPLFLKKQLLLKKNDQIDPIQLSLALKERGFREQDPVVEPATFICRAEVLDISLNSSTAYRIHFFDKTIESIAFLDLQTQLSTHACEQITIYPCQEFLPLPHHNLTALTQFIPETTPPLKRQKLLLQIQENLSPYRRALSLYYQKKYSLKDFLPQNSQFVWIDQNACLSEYQALQKEYENTEWEIKIPFEHFFSPLTSLPNEHHLTDIRLEQTQKDVYESVPSLRQKEKWDTTFQEWKKKNTSLFFFLPDDYYQALIKQRLEGFPATFYEERLSEGFFLKNEAFLTEKELFAPSLKKRAPKKGFSFADFAIDDLVVHKHFGIGQYKGIFRIKQDHLCLIDFFLIQYAEQDKLYIPAYNLADIHKYIGSENIKINRLGSSSFQKAKQEAQKQTQDLALNLLDVYAQREIQKGVIFSAPTPEYEKFESEFAFTETEDQINATAEIFEDMQSGKIMDRLICGDVGFGKTEVAMRASFKAAYDGKQVAVLVPTTILCRQHEHTFQERFKNHPFRIESLSRFKTPAEQKKICEATKNGQVDILIGTHRILSSDVQFADLGLFILDEEQRFGVKHKEQLKSLKSNTHVLTLTATPIPRTLQLSLSGMRDISLITTPPVDRIAVKTFIVQENIFSLKRAIEFELSRKGQVLFLCNSILKLDALEKKIQELLPDITTGIAHGQLPEKKLLQIMDGFYEGKIQVLFCTTIIESGIDIPQANTLIIKDAHQFGLTQLYQIRGRVGRSNQQAYCYLMIPENTPIQENATQRLNAIERLCDLGSGFQIASYDLEMRGAGELLGAEQSGHSTQIGYELYLKMLSEAVAHLKGKLTNEKILPEQKEPEIRAPFSTYLSEERIPEPHTRLKCYRSLSECQTTEQIDAMETQIKERFGQLQEPEKNLFWIIRLKLLLKHHFVEKCTAGPQVCSLVFSETLSNKKKRQFEWNQPQYAGQIASERLFFAVKKQLTSE